MNQYKLADKIRDLINADTTALVADVGEAPTPRNKPYAIIYPLGTSVTAGSMDDPQDLEVKMIQIRVVGDTPEQAAWGQERIRYLILDRTGSAWTNSLAVDGRETVSRTRMLEGAIVDGDTELRHVDDTYEIAMEA